MTSERRHGNQPVSVPAEAQRRRREFTHTLTATGSFPRRRWPGMTRNRVPVLEVTERHPRPAIPDRMQGPG
jgi:hypothetical protein